MANAYEIPGFSFTLVAGEDLRNSQFCGVDVNNQGLAITPTADGTRTIGFVQNKPNIGDPATLVVDGVTKALVGTGGVTAGQTVRCLTDGRVAASAAGSYAVGVALQTGAAGTLVAVLLSPSMGGGLVA